MHAASIIVAVCRGPGVVQGVATAIAAMSAVTVCWGIGVVLPSSVLLWRASDVAAHLRRCTRACTLASALPGRHPSCSSDACVACPMERGGPQGCHSTPPALSHLGCSCIRESLRQLGSSPGPREPHNMHITLQAAGAAARCPHETPVRCCTGAIALLHRRNGAAIALVAVGECLAAVCACRCSRASLTKRPGWWSPSSCGAQSCCAPAWMR